MSVEAMTAPSIAAEPENRSGSMFHESFSLNRPAIALILPIAADGGDEAALSSALRDSLGANYAKAMPRYARSCGLLEFGSPRLTPLGAHVLTHDPSLSLVATQWLMHYHLSAPSGPGPRFWHDLTVRLPEYGASFSGADLTEQVSKSAEVAQGRTLAERSLRTCATIYTGTYTKPEGLGALQVLQEAPNGFSIGEPEPVPQGVLAYALSHYWEGRYGHVQTRNLSDLSEPGGFGSLFFLSQFTLNKSLRGLTRRGVLELWQQAPPHQVTRPPTPTALLEEMYDN